MQLKLLHISDTHGYHKEFPMEKFIGYDMIIHSGDCSNYRDTARNYHEVADFIDWFAMIPIEHKIYVAGNHDTSIERRQITTRHFEDRAIIYLEHDSVEIEGYTIFGSPYTPTFCDWSFMKSRDKMHRLWESVPPVDILVTHGPPKGVRDLTENRDGEYEQVGDLSLMKWIFKNPPKLHLFGHIHDMDGIHNQGVSVYSKCPTHFSNGSCVHDGKAGLKSFGNGFTLQLSTVPDQV